MPRWSCYLGVYCLLQIIPILSETSLFYTVEPLWIAMFALLMLHSISNGALEILTKRQKLLLVITVILIAAAIVVVNQHRPLAQNALLLRERALFVAVLWCGGLLLDGTLAARASIKTLIQKLVPVGAISYALYVLHMPLMHFAKALTVQGARLVLSMLLAVALSVVLARWMELRYQPWVSAWLDSRLGKHLRSGVAPV